LRTDPRGLDNPGMGPYSAEYTVSVYLTGDVGFNGHIGGALNDGTAMGLCSVDGTKWQHVTNQSTTGQFGYDKEDFHISTPPNYKLRFPLNGDQWIRIDKTLDQLLREKAQHYNFYDRNCSTLQRDILKAGGIDVGSKWNPRSWVPVEVGPVESFMY
jgi:hypothetical protein